MVPAKEEILLSWSGGKDSSLSLYELRKSGSLRVKALLTTVTRDFDRISMHGVRRTLLHAQARSLGLPLEEVFIPKNASNEVYEDQMRAMLMRYKAQGVTKVAFGDLFLQDIRSYREERLSQVAMEGVFPVWGRNTADLAREFVDLGFRAVLCCVDPRKLGKEFCGREYDLGLLEDLPTSVDPCGENGEFHTFVYGGPTFTEEIGISRGETVVRDGFCFTDLLPKG